eukprot:3286575-Ditylum_brightwellii.AAC.1
MSLQCNMPNQSKQQSGRDAAYHLLPEVHSHIAGCYFLGILSPPFQLALPEEIPNGAVHNEYATIQNIMGLATENEVGGIYINCQKGIELYTALLQIDLQKPSTPIMTDYKMAE